MTKIRNLHEANILLKTYIPAVKEITGKDITLLRMVPLMKLLGNPEAKLKIIHIAGTSGKTSTAYYIAALLQAAGKNVGLTVSPHVESVAERIQINLLPLVETEFCAQLTQFLDIIKNADPRPTYYELIIAFAYWYFAKTGVDYAVIETGLGGLHDATNVAERSDKVCIITDIGLDHTKILGNTLTKIAAQKAGIIHAHNHVFCYKQGAAVMKVFRETCAERHAVLHEISSPFNRDMPVSLPLFQHRNWNLAKAVSDYMAKRDDLPILNMHSLLESMAIRIPARMEVIKYQDKTIIMDGAHNPQKLQALLTSTEHNYPDQAMAILAGFVQSRPQRLHANIRQLLPAANHLIVTSFVPNQEMYTKSADPLKITQYCHELGFNDCTIEPNHETAITKLLQRPEPILLITGSFYLLQHVRPLIIGLHD